MYSSSFLNKIDRTIIHVFSCKIYCFNTECTNKIKKSLFVTRLLAVLFNFDNLSIFDLDLCNIFTINVENACQLFLVLSRHGVNHTSRGHHIISLEQLKIKLKFKRYQIYYREKKRFNFCHIFRTVPDA